MRVQRFVWSLWNFVYVWGEKEESQAEGLNKIRIFNGRDIFLMVVLEICQWIGKVVVVV